MTAKKNFFNMESEAPKDLDIARAFAPFVSIIEFENTLAINKSVSPPVFLRRNLSYGESRRWKKKQEACASHILKLSLECVVAPPTYPVGSSIPVVVAICSRMHESGGQGVVPIKACMASIPVPLPVARDPRGTLGPDGEAEKKTRVKINLSIPDSILRRDMVVLVLHQNDARLSYLHDHILQARHGESYRSIDCTINSKTAFSWFAQNSSVLYSIVDFGEMMLKAQHLQNSERRVRQGMMELQPGRIHCWQGEGERPTSLVLVLGAIGEMTPMLRYKMTVDTVLFTGKAPVNNNETTEIRDGNAVLASWAHPPVQVTYCGYDGDFRVRSRVPGFHCLFESCSTRCSSFSGLQQHLLACHSYFDYYFKSKDESPEVWLRCRREWFDARNRSFLPSTATPKSLHQHPLHHLLVKSAMWLTFSYYCPRNQRPLRFVEGSRAPEDRREVRMINEAVARVIADLDEEKVIDEARHVETVTVALQDLQAKKRERNASRQRQVTGQGLVRRVQLPVLTSKGLPKFYHSKSYAAMSLAEINDVNGVDSDEEEDYVGWKVCCVVLCYDNVTSTIVSLFFLKINRRT